MMYSVKFYGHIIVISAVKFSVEKLQEFGHIV